LSFLKIIFFVALSTLTVISAVALWKKGKEKQEPLVSSLKPVVVSFPPEKTLSPPPFAPGNAPLEIKDDFPEVDRIYQLFATEGGRLPIVETITYSSTVPWLKGRPAWIADYASFYSTSRHFIARSLNGKPDYFSQNVFPGSRFNVFRNDKHFTFYILVDVKRCKMGFYYVDLDTNERVLLKTYRVGLGRLDAQKPSGSLTPLGKFTLGNKIAVYNPGVMGYFHEKQTEMVTVFGTRWIPFETEIGQGISSPKGYGIQGAPWKKEGGEEVKSVGGYESDGCIRLLQKDMEELFAIVVTKPTIVEIVRDFREARLPGKEVAAPSR